MINTTVIVCAHPNRQQFLPHAIDSVDKQTIPTRMILMNDDTLLSVKLNKALKSVTTKYVKVLADDDLLIPDCVDTLEKAIEGKDFAHANAINFGHGLTDTIQKPLDGAVTLEKMLKRNQIHGGTVLYSVEALKSVEGWNELLWTAEEYDLHLKLLKQGFKLGYVDKEVCRYRRHDLQKSIGQQSRGRRSQRNREVERIKNQYR